MRFLLDESMESAIGRFLQSHDHDVTAIVRDYARSIPDRDVLSIAVAERRVLVTNDKDFTLLVFNEFPPHSGVILFRLGRGGTIEAKINRLQYVLTHHTNDFDAFITVHRSALAIRRTPIVDGE